MFFEKDSYQGQILLIDKKSAQKCFNSPDNTTKPSGTRFAIIKETNIMDKKILGFVLLILGFGGIFFSGFSFINGNGGLNNMTQVIVYLIFGAALFFTGINYTIPQNNIVQKSPAQSNYSPENT